MKSQEVALAKLPDTPGVYFFRLGDEILYIGKATSLRDRTRSYFAKDLIATRGPLIVDMVFKADRVTYEETDSVLEALILEANLIKKHQPYYNTKEKDDKSWNYVCITDEECPKVLVERGKNIDFKNLITVKGIRINEWYGPFTSGTQLKEAMKIVRRIFPFVDASSAKKDNYEFYRQLGLTPDVSGEEKMAAYKRSIRNLKYFFEGKKKTIIKDLEREMKAAAKAMRFEEARVIRNQLFVLGHINDVSLLKGDASIRKEKAGFRIEAYDIAHMSGKNMVGVMTVMEDGEINKKEYRTFNIKGFSKANDTGALEEVLSRRLRHTEWGMPDLVVADGGEAQLRVACQVLERYQLKIPVVSVVKDERHQPRDILGDADMAAKHKKEILLANNESHRFSIRLHKEKRNKNFLA
jgi:excinuclease UvrABC nuclease subunit